MTDHKCSTWRPQQMKCTECGWSLVARDHGLYGYCLNEACARGLRPGMAMTFAGDAEGGRMQKQINQIMGRARPCTDINEYLGH